jgi:DNA repair protein SbcD/Mre11
MRKRICVAGDLHAHHLSPTHRKDNYPESIVAKLRESLYIAREQKVDAYIHLGDIFHTLDPDGSIRNAVINTFKYDDSGEEWEFPRYTCVGNHDIKRSYANMPRSALKSLLESGGVQLVDEYLEDLRIGFIHWQKDAEQRLLGGLMQDLGHEAIIWCCHTTILSKRHPHLEEQVVFDELPTNEDCKLVITGHIHHPDQCERFDGVKFVNPGSICRRDRTPENFSRVPKVLIVDYALDGSKLKYKLMPITCARVGDDIFDQEEYEKDKKQEKQTKEYLDRIESMEGWNDDDAMSLKESGAAKGIPDDILELAIAAVENAQENE